MHFLFDMDKDVGDIGMRAIGLYSPQVSLVCLFAAISDSVFEQKCCFEKFCPTHSC
jgi:hypothetical protein